MAAVNVLLRSFITRTTVTDAPTVGGGVVALPAIALSSATPDGELLAVNRRVELKETVLSRNLTIRAQGWVVLDLGGCTLSGSLTISGAGSVLVKGGTVHGHVLFDEGLKHVMCHNLFVVGSLRVNGAKGKAFLVSTTVSNVHTTAIHVDAKEHVFANAVSVSHVMLPETPAENKVIWLVSQDHDVDVNSLKVNEVTSFAKKMQVVVLDAQSNVRATNISIHSAAAPRGVVEGVVPTAGGDKHPVLANIDVEARSGGEAAQMQLVMPEGIIVTETSGEGFTRPIVASAEASRVQGHVAPVVHRVGAE